MHDFPPTFRPMSHLQFYRVTFVGQLYRATNVKCKQKLTDQHSQHSRGTKLHRTQRCTVRKRICATWNAVWHAMSHLWFFAWQQLQVWHRSYRFSCLICSL